MMLNRRSRILIKPNLGNKSVLKKEDKPVVESVKEVCEVEGSQACADLLPSASEKTPPHPPAPHLSARVDREEKSKELWQIPSACQEEVRDDVYYVEEVFISPSPSPLTSPTRPDKSLEIGSPMLSRVRTFSNTTVTSTSSKNKSKKFTGDEKLNPKTMRMCDLIEWNPRSEKGMHRKHLENIERPQPLLPKEESRLAAPQLKLDASGKLVVDEKSLVVDERVSDSVWNIIDDDRSARPINSGSFRRWRRGAPWTQQETDIFYEILRATGPDFGLMHDFFPGRARKELKSKFNREEKVNLERINMVLSKPYLLEDSLYERVALMTEKLEEDLKKSKALKEKKGKRKKVAEEEVQEEEREIEQEEESVWSEESADLLREAEEIIRGLQGEEEERERLQREKKESRKQKALSRLAEKLLRESRVEAEKEAEERGATPTGSQPGFPEDSSSSESGSETDEEFIPGRGKKRSGAGTRKKRKDILAKATKEKKPELLTAK